MIYMGYILLINIKNVYKVIEKEEMHVYIHHNFNSVHEDKKNGWKKKKGGKYRWIKRVLLEWRQFFLKLQVLSLRLDNLNEK